MYININDDMALRKRHMSHVFSAKLTLMSAKSSLLPTRISNPQENVQSRARVVHVQGSCSKCPYKSLACSHHVAKQGLVIFIKGWF